MILISEFKVDIAVFKWLLKVKMWLWLLHLVISWKILHQFFNHWKSQPVVSCTHSFFPHSKLQVIARNSDWFIALFTLVTLIIGQSNYYFDISFSTVNNFYKFSKPLYGWNYQRLQSYSWVFSFSPLLERIANTLKKD